VVHGVFPVDVCFPMSTLPPASIPDPPEPGVRLAVDRVREFLTRCLVKKGMFKVEAEMVSARALDSDVYGLPDFGASGLDRLICRIDAGDIDPRGQTHVVHNTDRIAVLDGGTGFGEVALTRAIHLAAERLRAGLKGTVLVGNSRAVESVEPAAIFAVQLGYFSLVTSSGISETGTESASRATLVVAGRATAASPGETSGAKTEVGVSLARSSRKIVSFETGVFAEIASGPGAHLLKPFVVGAPGQLNVSHVVELVPASASGGSTRSADLSEILASSNREDRDALSSEAIRRQNTEGIVSGLSYPTAVLEAWHKLALKLKVPPPWTPAAS
jgi:hypothetical protein